MVMGRRGAATSTSAPSLVTPPPPHGSPAPVRASDSTGSAAAAFQSALAVALFGDKVERLGHVLKTNRQLKRSLGANVDQAPRPLGLEQLDEVVAQPLLPVQSLEGHLVEQKIGGLRTELEAGRRVQSQLLASADQILAETSPKGRRQGHPPSHGASPGGYGGSGSACGGGGGGKLWSPDVDPSLYPSTHQSPVSSSLLPPIRHGLGSSSSLPMLPPPSLSPPSSPTKHAHNLSPSDIPHESILPAAERYHVTSQVLTSRPPRASMAPPPAVPPPPPLPGSLPRPHGGTEEVSLARAALHEALEAALASAHEAGMDLPSIEQGESYSTSPERAVPPYYLLLTPWKSCTLRSKSHISRPVTTFRPLLQVCPL